MTIFVDIRRLFIASESYSSIKRFGISRYFHSERLLTSNLANRVQGNVGIFWDLENKPPESITPYYAATRLKKAMIEFGVVRYMITFANQHSFKNVSPEVVLNQLERKGVVKAEMPYSCGVCGRRFHTNERLTNHFRQIHQRENKKRLNQIESTKGKMRVNLIARYAMKMEKYKNAARCVLSPETGCELPDELRRAGFWVRTVPDRPQAAHIALKKRMVDMMDKRLIDCVVLVSDDSDFVGVLREAKYRSLRTVVVGDSQKGLLKRTADDAFSWHEIMVGKAKEEAVSVVERLKDRDISKRLEFTYNPGIERREICGSDASSSEGSDVENFFSSEDDDDDQQTKGGRAWWKHDSCGDSEEKIHEPNEAKSIGSSV